MSGDRRRALPGRHTYKRLGLLFILGIVLLLPSVLGRRSLAALPGASHAPAGVEADVLFTGTKATYIIVMIGDGMGPEQVEAARYYDGDALSFETLPFWSEMTTYSAGDSVTDSAAAPIIGVATLLNGLKSPITSRTIRSPLFSFWQRMHICLPSTTAATVTMPRMEARRCPSFMLLPLIGVVR